MTLSISEDDVKKLFTIKSAIPVIEEVFRMAGEGTAENPARFRLPIKKGFLQFGAAALHAKDVIGFKLVLKFLGLPPKQILNFLYSTETGELLAVMRAHAMSRFRTSATTAVAVKYLSAPDASVVGMYGAGREAETQLEAVCAVRQIREAHVYSRNQANREAFCARMSERLNIKVIPLQAPEQVPLHADIIVTVTRSATPVLFGAWITRPGLVVGVGANHWDEREIDEKVVEKAKLVVVDEKEHSKLESGDLLWPISHGLWRWDKVYNLGEIVTGRVPVPNPAENLILFESHGLAIEDMAIAEKAYELARAHGLGHEIEL